MNGSKLHIKILEDDAYYGEVVKKYVSNHFELTEPGIDISVALYSRVQEFLDNLDKDTDIIIMDYYVENNDGEVMVPGNELLKIIKHHCNHCKVIVISAQKDENIVSELFKEGIEEYILKESDALLKLSKSLDGIVNGMTVKKNIY